MDLGGGDAEEHAILLCNYLLYLKKNAWVVMGFQITEGDTSFVLVQENNEYLLLDPSTGRSYSSTDSSCPLYNIGCVFNDKNVAYC